MILKIIGRIFTILGIFSFICLVLFGGSLLVDRYLSISEISEIDRIPSPDGKVDAVLMKYDAGATTSSIIRIYIVPPGTVITAGSKLTEKYVPIFTAQHVENRKVNWLKNNLLAIEYDKAEILAYRNCDYPLAPKNVDYVVWIKEICVNTNFY